MASPARTSPKNSVSKQRPVFLKMNAGYSIGNFARQLGVADNEFGDFEISGKKFNAKEIRVSYGSRVHSTQISTSLGIELDPHKEIYLKGSLQIPFANQTGVWFKEKGQFFTKEKRLKIDKEQLLVLRNDAPYREPLFKETVFSITAGLLFK